MPIAVVHEWSKGGESTTHYDAISDRMGLRDAPPEGLIVHAAGTTEGGGFRVFDVWESREAYDRFERERLMPAVKEVMAGSKSTAPPPTVSVYELHAFMLP